jgi:hypothetical protein
MPNLELRIDSQAIRTPALASIGKTTTRSSARSCHLSGSNRQKTVLLALSHLGAARMEALPTELATAPKP